MQAIINKTLIGSALLALLSPFVVLAGDEAEALEPARTAAPRSHGPMIVHERHGKMTTSTNWSGYAVTDPTGSVTEVSGSWIVPAIVGSCPSQSQYASVWVGIDGYNSSTVEQIGTDSDCQNGKPVYYAWYEFYPHFSYNIPITINPGNTVSADVNYSGGKFTVTITNTSTGQTWFTTQKMPNAKRTSAEWIVEAPYSGGVLPLADFGTVNFGPDYATIGPVSGPIGSSGFDTNLNEITMVAKDGTTVKAQPSDPPQNVWTTFTDTWHNAGP